jgi:hypothetical protein
MQISCILQLHNLFIDLFGIHDIHQFITVGAVSLFRRNRNRLRRTWHHSDNRLIKPGNNLAAANGEFQRGLIYITLEFCPVSKGDRVIDPHRVICFHSCLLRACAAC